MALIRDVDLTGMVRYRVRCDHPGCQQVHTPPLVSRKASDARHQGRHAGWKVPERARYDRDRCPKHRGATR